MSFSTRIDNATARVEADVRTLIRNHFKDFNSKLQGELEALGAMRRERDFVEDALVDLAQKVDATMRERAAVTLTPLELEEDGEYLLLESGELLLVE